MTLWVRGRNGLWTPRGERSATVRAADIKDDEAAGNGTSFQVQFGFSFAQSTVGGNQVHQNVRQSSPKLGAASARAASDAREAFERELAAHAFPLD